MSANIKHNIISFFTHIFCVISPILPMAIADIYYGYNPYECMEKKYNNYNHNNLNIKTWILVNGYISLFSIVFTFFIFIIVMIYKESCQCMTQLFENSLFIKSYILTKILFNISWTITGSVIFSQVYNNCPFNISFYIWFRITIMFIMILISLKNFKYYVLDKEQDISVDTLDNV
jgi:magnesium-transporting ATPase (P-type)